ncbi:MAG: hypothetical protein A2945_02040 [Candidatus Liptonbacteria bacterium RIFCSPLOWO2_01_FULL_52_25]|uniref:Uncharacterized protein n=1 Tax=Candidatus Liptonbacteria bacterium RIFCSPLOWO2_01_FULL_52_25 TaxID=1798650 RepID=A0A1G2CEV0_9BACT|nr:MAG: hypothetical protein A2945_02040 [Candidatus Liptonbacteria bacterium RIFCSPLOWO2_01_FULL_52_25]
MAKRKFDKRNAIDLTPDVAENYKRNLTEKNDRQTSSSSEPTDVSASSSSEPAAPTPALKAPTSPAPAPAATRVPAPTAPAPLPAPVASSPTLKFNRPTFKRGVTTLSAEERAARQQWVTDSAAGVRDLIVAYTQSMLDPQSVPMIPAAYDAEGNVTEWREGNPEDLVNDLVGTISQVRERGLHEAVVVIAMDEMLLQFPHEREFLVSFSAIARRLDNFYFPVERNSPLVERGEVNWLPGDEGLFQPYGSIYAQSGRIMDAVNRFTADVRRREREELQAGALPLKDLHKAGAGEFHFSQGREGNNPPATFRVLVQDGKIYPLAASESYRGAFAEMVRLKVFIFTGSVSISHFQPSDKLREETASHVRMFHHILHAYWRREFQVGEKGRSEQAARVAKDDVYMQDRTKAFEMRNRAGLIPLADTLLTGTPGSSNLHLAPRKRNGGKEIPAFMWQGKKHFHVNGILTRYEDGKLAITDCCASDEVLFAGVREPVEPGENFKNLSEPAREILRRVAATIGVPKATEAPAKETPSAETPDTKAETAPEQNADATPEVTPDVPASAETPVANN